MASAYLYRTQVTATSTKKFTFSTWVRRSGVMSDYEGLLNSYTSDASRNGIYFGSDTKLNVYFRTSSSSQIYYETTRTFRDTHGWYHIVVAVDTTQSTAGDRVKIYVNGVQETAFGSSTNPGQDTDFSNIGVSGKDLEVGRMRYGSSNIKYLNGQMTHVHFTDGYVYAASDFGETDATTGIWKPKVAPTGITYGNNGFFLKMDNSGNMGLDSSGESHNLTTSGTIIQVPDTPSNIFATINSLDNKFFQGTFSNINNTVASHSSTYGVCTSSLGMSKGKYYVEAKLSSGTTGLFGVVGRQAISATESLGTSLVGGVGIQNTGRLRQEGTDTNSWSNTWTTNDILQVALDLDNNKFYFGINGTYQNSGNPSTGANGLTIIAPSSTPSGFYFFSFSDSNSGGASTFQYNFGQGFFGTTAVASAQTPDDGIGVFEYDPPTGYRALCTKSLNAQEYS